MYRYNAVLSGITNTFQGTETIQNCAFRGGNFDDLVSIPTMISTVVVSFEIYSFN